MMKVMLMKNSWRRLSSMGYEKKSFLFKHVNRVNMLIGEIREFVLWDSDDTVEVG